jgi:hypothetical protein
MRDEFREEDGKLEKAAVKRQRPCLSGGIAGNIHDGAIFVKGSAVASSGPSGNVLYFFRRQLACAHAI